MFKDLLSDLPMPQDQLAAALQVDQSTVSRWVSGKSLPSTEQMREMVRLVQAHIAEIQGRMDRTNEFLDALDASRREGLEGMSGLRKVHELLTRWPQRWLPARRRRVPNRNARAP